MAALPANVTISDLPTGTTVTGSELFEAIQTSGGVGASVQLSASQIVALVTAILPVDGGTGTLLSKTSATSFSTQWTAISSLVSTISTSGLATSGSATALVLAISTAGIGSTQLGANAIFSSAISTAAIFSSAIATNQIGSTQFRQSVGLSVVGNGSTVTGNVVDVTASAGNKVLMSNAANTTIAFVTPGLVLLTTLSPSGLTTAFDTTSFTSTYSRLLIKFENLTPTNNTATLQMQVATVGTSFISGSYLSIAQVNVSSVIVTDTSTTVMLLSGSRATTALQSSTLYGLNGSIELVNPTNAVFRKSMVGEVTYAGAGAAVNTTTLAQAVVNAVFDGNSNALTGVGWSFNAGTIATGTIRIYGVA